MHKLLKLTAIVLGALLAGCVTAPRDGSEQTSYYYSNRAPASSVASVLVKPAPPFGKNGPVDVSRIVYFDFDKSQVKPEYNRVVEAHANFLKQRRTSKVALEGHTDERGGREYNLALGQRRAEAVKQSLILLGVADHQIEALSWGMEKPASLNKTEAGYQLNRRAEFTYR